MKIDLHCHTKKIKKGDAETRNVSVELFKQKIEDADIKIIAITNHNHFDIDQYYKFRESVQNCCQVWPGVELDVQGKSGKNGHMIVVANPDNVSGFGGAVNAMVKDQNVDTVTFSLTEVFNALDKYDVVYIFHVHKAPAVDDSDIDELRSLVEKETRIFSEPSNLRTLGVFANLGGNVIIGSDVHNWNNYEKSNFSELRLPVSSFSQFCMLAERDETVVMTLLGDRKFGSLTAHPYSGIDLTLTLYKDVNIIFGQKGTGKSEILKTLITALQNQGVQCQTYIGGERESQFKEFLDTTDMKRECSSVGALECKEEFDHVLSFTDHRPTLLGEYFDWYATKDHNANKRRMQITESAFLSVPDKTRYDQIHIDFDIVQNLCHFWNKLNAEQYLSLEEIECLNALLIKLSGASKDQLLTEFAKYESVELANKSITQIKQIADKHSNTKSKPASTGFLEYANKRISLKKDVDSILANINDKCSIEREPIGYLENKGNIYVQGTYRMLCDKSRTEEFRCGIKKLRQSKNLLQKISSGWYEVDIVDSLAEFQTLCNEESINSTVSYIGLSKKVVVESGEEYNPSSGEKSILLLQKVLSSPADAYLLDEPELGMGNSYIDATIRPKLTSLAKQRKIVVVATHNANLAVRTLPYCSILRTHDGGKYSTYAGNPFHDHLVNIENASDIKSWKNESMHTLEGGSEAFYERKEIYESSTVQS